MGVLVYYGDKDEVVGTETIHKVFNHIPGDSKLLVKSSEGLGHSLINHGKERKVIADTTKTFFDKFRSTSEMV